MFQNKFWNICVVEKKNFIRKSRSARERKRAYHRERANTKSERLMRASRERERERACERVSELARSLAKDLKLSSSRSLARQKIEVA